MASARRLRVMVFSSSRDTRLLLKAALAIEADVQVVADASTREELLEVVQLLQPHVAIVDFSDGVGLMPMIMEESPQTRILVRLDAEIARNLGQSLPELETMETNLTPAQIIRAVREADRGRAPSARQLAVYPVPGVE